jgi:transketolase
MPKPLDEAAVLHAARRSRLLVTVEDHFQTGGLYSAVAECLVRERESVDLLPLALDERWFRPALLDDVLVYEGFTGPQIAARITARLAHPKRP